MTYPQRNPTNDEHEQRLVSPEQFTRLLLSRRRLERLDEPERGLRGLLDRATGELYVTPELDLRTAVACGTV